MTLTRAVTGCVRGASGITRSSRLEVKCHGTRRGKKKYGVPIDYTLCDCTLIDLIQVDRTILTALPLFTLFANRAQSTPPRMITVSALLLHTPMYTSPLLTKPLVLHLYVPYHSWPHSQSPVYRTSLDNTTTRNQARVTHTHIPHGCLTIQDPEADCQHSSIAPLIPLKVRLG